MNKENSTVLSRQELKTLFDSGAITAEEYEAYKKRIIYGIAIPVKPRSATPSPASPFAGKPTETKIIYPTPPENAKVPTTALPVTEQNYAEENFSVGVDPGRRKKLVPVALTVLGTLFLLNLLVYWYFHPSDPEQVARITKPEPKRINAANLPAENLPSAAVKATAERSDRNPLTNNDKAVVARPTATSGNTSNTAASATVGAGIITDKNEIIYKAEQKLKAYYTDMQAAPFKASLYFAPQVERYYTLLNTTPAAITKNINAYHFPEFLNGQSRIQAGSMKVVNTGNNGYELTYLEHGSAFRQSKKQKQEVKAMVRIRFNPDFKITYFRQERLLQNRFIKE